MNEILKLRKVMHQIVKSLLFLVFSSNIFICTYSQETKDNSIIEVLKYCVNEGTINDSPEIYLNTYDANNSEKRLQAVYYINNLIFPVNNVESPYVPLIVKTEGEMTIKCGRLGKKMVKRGFD